MRTATVTAAPFILCRKQCHLPRTRFSHAAAKLLVTAVLSNSPPVKVWAGEGSVDTSAVNGLAGDFLLDPANAIIHSGWLDPIGWVQLVIKAENLANDMHRNGTMTVEATNTIDVGTDLSFLASAMAPSTCATTTIRS